jgi:autotransporter passenger strand-loop-strand repeat protein
MGTTIGSGQTVKISTTVFDDTVSSGGVLKVLAGGSADATQLYSGGSMTVFSGGTASATAMYGGTITVSSGGSVSATNLVSSGTENVLAGGTDTGFGGGVLNVSSGGLAIDPFNGAVISSGGTEDVNSGGSAGYGTVLNSGLVSVASAGLLRNETLEAGATLDVASGGRAIGLTLAGAVVVSAAPGATLDSFNVTSGATLTISAGVVAVNDSASLGGAVIVAAGATASGLSIESDGSAVVRSGGTAVSASVFAATGYSASLTANSGATLTDPTNLDETLIVASGATLDVTTSGTAEGATLEAGAVLLASSAVTLNSMVFGSGQTLTLSGGMTESNALFQSGAAEFVAQNGLAQNDTIALGGSQTVLAGGSAAGTDVGELVFTYVSSSNTNVSSVLSGGDQVVSAGGVASGGLIAFGGTQTVLAGGTAIGASPQSGGVELVASGGLAIDTVAFGGGSAVISSGGTLEVLSGQDAGGVTLLSGAVLLTPTTGGGTLQGESVGSGMTLAVPSGVTEFDTVISAFGAETVGSGHAASGVTVYAQGILTVGSGGTVSNTNLGDDASTLVSGSYVPTLQPGGDLFVSAGGVADETFIVQGGQEIILSGGIGSGAAVSSGGAIVVSSGGTMESPAVESGGLLTISSGGVDEGGQLGALGISDPAFGTPGGSAVILDGGMGSGIMVYSGGVLDVSAGGTIVNPTIGAGTLDLAAGAVVSGAITFASGIPGSDLIIGGTAMPSVPISGFGPSDTIDLAGIAFGAGGSVVLGPSGTLMVTEDGKTYDLNLVSAGVAGHALSLAKDANGGTMVEVACFAAGTRIATPSGDAPVEALRPGDAVLALQDGVWQPARVRWVGNSTVDLARHPQPAQAAPICIRAHAIGPDLPRRDLWLSPDHALLLDGGLIQAQSLRNGATVTQEFPPHITYCHIELDRHAVLLAEGVAAESYLDTGNRALFAGEAGTRALHPDFASAAAWNERACAKLHLTGPAVTAAHARLLLRAVERGWSITADPGLRILADGREMLAFSPGGGTWEATLPAGTRDVRLASRWFVPTWFAEDDRRRLGVAVSALRIGGARLPRAAFAAGWHAQEREWRWTDGEGVLALKPLRRAARLELTLARAGGRYWAAPVAITQAGRRIGGASAPR